MGAIVNLLLRVTDLVEAEGRVARKAVGDVALGVAILVTACVLAGLACIAGAGALFFVLANVLPPAGALGIVGLVFALAGWAVAATGLRMVRPRR
ncbi:MAG: hypothetical protein U0575_13300 [Phycisphaerales bacterium]